MAGQALQFPGIDGCVATLNAAGTFLFTNAFTFECWYKPTADDMSGYIMLMSYSRDVTPTYLFLGMYGGKAFGQYRDGGSSRTITSDSQLTVNAWNHLVLRGELNQKPALFLNNVKKEASLVLSSGVSDNAAYIRCLGYPAGSGQHPHGAMDEARMYTVALTDSHISEHYNGGKGEYGFAETGLCNGYHCDGGNLDYSGNGFDYTLSSGITYTDGIVDYPFKIQVNSQWVKPFEVKVQVGSAWKSVDKLFINVGDIWKGLY